MTCDRYIIGDDGEPEPCEDLLTWALWMETHERITLQTHYGRIMVSTIFLGLDHNFWGSEKPVLWETMVFRRLRKPRILFGGYPLWRDTIDRHTRRYSSKLEALQGHHEVCIAVERCLTAPRKTRKALSKDEAGQSLRPRERRRLAHVLR